MVFSMIFLTIHKISYDKIRISTESVETRWLGGSVLMVYRNNAGKLGSGFISVCLETRWLGQKAVSMCRNDPVGRGCCTDRRATAVKCPFHMCERAHSYV